MFDEFAEAYEAMIDWPKRLANEAGFFRRRFDASGVQSAVDVACGTGRHAAMFHDWGLRVEGADLSSNMVAQARATFGESERLRWVVRGFDQPVTPSEPFDAAISIGNSLALAPDLATAQRAVEQMFAMVTGGGLVVIHLLNLWSLPEGPCVWQKCRRVRLSSGDSLILKGVHRCGTRGYVDLAVVRLDADPPGGSIPLRAESTKLLGFEAAQLEQIARAAGGEEIQFFGGYQDQPYDRETSTDLILVAAARHLP